LFIPVKSIQTEIKEFKGEREIAHTVYTGSLLNQELHPVFPETIGESTKQPNLDYLHTPPKK